MNGCGVAPGPIDVRCQPASRSALRKSRIAHRLTQAQFAEEIGLTHEALYRALAALERAGQIARGEGEIRLAARRARVN